MSPRIDTRSYTNVILTVIAVFLCLLVLHAYQVSVVSDAQAQEIATPRPTPRIGTGGYAPTGHSAPLDVTNAQLVRDVEVAAATLQVAAANREIAASLRDVAEAIRAAGQAAGASRPAPGTGTAVVIPPSPPVGGPLPERGTVPAPTPGSDLNISVEPSR